MKIQFGKAKTGKDTEAKTGPKILVTVNNNKITASPTVVEKLKLKEQEFNIAIVDLENGNPAVPCIYIVEEDGYKLGKSNSVSAAEPIRTLLEHMNRSREEFLVEGDGNPRSFNLGVNFATPIHVFSNADGQVFSTQEEAGDDAEHQAFYPLTYINDVVKGSAEEAEEGIEEDENEEGSKSKSKGRRKKD